MPRLYVLKFQPWCSVPSAHSVPKYQLGWICNQTALSTMTMAVGDDYDYGRIINLFNLCNLRFEL